jgi:protein O-GlcNAc transferase
MTNTPPDSSVAPPRLEEAIDAARAGDWSAARLTCRRLLALDPSAWPSWHLASLAGAALERAPPVVPFRHAVDLAPERAELWGALAAAFGSRGQHRDAIHAGRRALTLAPSTAESTANLGIAFKESGETPAAARWLDRAEVLAPGNPVILNNRAVLHIAAGEDARAAPRLRAAVAAAPGYGDARLNLATLERRFGRPGAALSLLDGALRVAPSESDHLAELGTVLVTIGEARAGIVWLRRALAAQPDNAKAMSSLLGALSYPPDVSEDERKAAYDASAAQIAMRIARRASAPMRPAPRSAAADRRLAIGYVSASFHSHPMAAQVIELLRHHRRDQVRIAAYADIHRRDAVTQRVQGLVEIWRETTDLADGAVADLVRGDGIDILVFLAPHEDGSRRALPEHRAAPVQVSLHDIATSGLSSIDAWLTDPILHPADTTEWFSETLVRLPTIFLFPDFGDDTPPESPRQRPEFVFASFNNPAKLSEPTLAAWAEILHRVPGSVLALRYGTLFDDPAVAGRVRALMGCHGIAPDRLRLSAGSLPRPDHMRAIQDADVVLDPFPYNGNTATIEALWAGVPVVTLQGTRFLGRMGAAILSHAGHEDLVAGSVEEYVARAVALAADPERRRVLRTALRGDLRRSAMFDGRSYAIRMEEALRALTRP